jgi:hypothetical protein
MVKQINEHTSYDLSDDEGLLRIATKIAFLAYQDVKHNRLDRTGLQVLTYLNVRHRKTGHVKLCGTIYRAYREFLDKEKAS